MSEMYSILTQPHNLVHLLARSNIPLFDRDGAGDVLGAAELAPGGGRDETD